MLELTQGAGRQSLTVPTWHCGRLNRPQTAIGIGGGKAREFLTKTTHGAPQASPRFWPFGNRGSCRAAARHHGNTGTLAGQSHCVCLP
jgi:hypothetical protein